MNAQVQTESIPEPYFLLERHGVKIRNRSLEVLLGKPIMKTGSRLEQGRKAMVYWPGHISNVNTDQNTTGIIAVRTKIRGPIIVLADSFLGEAFNARLTNPVWTVNGVATLQHTKRGGYWYKVDIDLTTLWTSLYEKGVLSETAANCQVSL